MNLLEAKELMRLTVSLIPPGRTVKKVPFAELEVVLRQSRVLAGKSELELRRLLFTIYPVYKNNRRRARVIKIDVAAAKGVLAEMGIVFGGIDDLVGTRIIQEAVQ